LSPERHQRLSDGGIYQAEVVNGRIAAVIEAHGGVDREYLFQCEEGHH
jgi:hypothetical protein